MNKPQLRKYCKQLRDEFSREERQTQSKRICQHIAQLPEFLGADQVFFYLPLAEEIDLLPLVTLFPHKIWGIPRCSAQDLLWHHYDPQRLTMRTYGLREPDSLCQSLDPALTGLVLVPTLGCSHAGYRLGYGGGYYDRFLACYALTTLGIMGTQGWITHFDPDPWDQRLKGVVTEAGVQWFDQV